MKQLLWVATPEIALANEVGGDRLVIERMEGVGVPCPFGLRIDQDGMSLDDQ